MKLQELDQAIIGSHQLVCIFPQDFLSLCRLIIFWLVLKMFRSLRTPVEEQGDKLQNERGHQQQININKRTRIEKELLYQQRPHSDNKFIDYVSIGGVDLDLLAAC